MDDNSDFEKGERAYFLPSDEMNMIQQPPRRSTRNNTCGTAFLGILTFLSGVVFTLLVTSARSYGQLSYETGFSEEKICK